MGKCEDSSDQTLAISITNLSLTDTEAELSWEAVANSPNVQFRVDLHQTENASTDASRTEETSQCSIKLSNLNPDTEFEATVSNVTKVGNSIPSTAIRFRTLPQQHPISCSEYVKNKWCKPCPLVKLAGEEFAGDIYEITKRKISSDVPCKCKTDSCICPACYDVGDSKYSVNRPKILLIVGETGTGKSTFINGIANAFYEVKYSDNFRFKLITEAAGNNAATGNQAFSQTSIVSVYTLFPVVRNNFRSAMNCPLTIIDTPGFGDTRGLEEDKIIVRMIAKVLGEDGSSIPGMNGILHGIGFVVKASQNRLTIPQKYIFDQVFSLFGKDVEQIILPVMTFADSNEPQALAALKEYKVPYKTYLKFNNGMLYADNRGFESLRHTCISAVAQKKMEMKVKENSLNWDQGELHYLEMFEVMESVKEGISLKDTRDVLRSRRTLEISMEGLMGQVRVGIATLTRLEENLNLIESLDAIIKDADMKKTRKVLVPKVRKAQVTHGGFVTLCMTCSKTCHSNCIYSDDKDKMKCSAMDSNGYCTVCEKHCYWNQHCNRNYFFEDYVEQEIVTVQEIANKYQVNMKDRDAKKQLTERLLDEFLTAQSNLSFNLVTVYKCLQELDRLALRQYPLSVVDYVDNLIRAEENAKKPGWENRAKYLRDTRESAKIIAAARKGEDPFGELKEKVLSRCKKALEEELKSKNRFKLLGKLTGWFSGPGGKPDAVQQLQPAAKK